MHNPNRDTAVMMKRRTFLRTSVGSAALTSLLNPAVHGVEHRRRVDAATPTRTHFAPRARSVIYIHLVGAPSQLDLFDPKPVLVANNGKPCPEKYFTEGQQFAFIRGRPTLLGSRYKFTQHGESGMWFSNLLPHLAGVADQLCMIRSLHTEQINHGPAQLFMMTGHGRLGRPSIGSWISYGLGTENADLPTFVVLNSGPSIAGAGSALWGPGFLPGAHQGVELRGSGDPVLFLSDPPGVTRDDRRRIIDSVNYLNTARLADVGDPEIATRIAQYELAFRMQTSVPDLMDIKGEPKHVLEMYGAKPGQASFANNALLARRLVERGVRFVQLFDSDWDHHNSLSKRLPEKCKEVDKPVAALIRDLHQRGLLDDTLVVWGAEFGRTPVKQTSDGRDHHIDAFSAWMAGGGAKAGHIYGASDDIGFKVVADPMHVNDFHATILHLLGIDHERLTFHYQGRDFRLTDVSGEVAYAIIDGRSNAK
jgi:hypothetical protein